MDEVSCACCNRPIESRNAWKGDTGAFYCSGFCADSEYEDSPNTLRRAFGDDNREAA